LKDEFHHTSTDDGQVSIRNVSSDEASVDAPSTLTANSVNAKEKGAVLIEQQDNVIPADKYDSTAAAGEQAASADALGSLTHSPTPFPTAPKGANRRATR